MRVVILSFRQGWGETMTLDDGVHRNLPANTAEVVAGQRALLAGCTISDIFENSRR